MISSQATSRKSTSAMMRADSGPDCILRRADQEGDKVIEGVVHQPRPCLFCCPGNMRGDDAFLLGNKRGIGFRWLEPVRFFV